VFIQDFNKLKLNYEEEANRRNELEKKISAVDRISKQIESDLKTTKDQSSSIKENLTMIDHLTSYVKDEVSHFETQATRDHQHKTKMMVQFRITLENLNTEFNYFRKEFNKRMDQVQHELTNGKINKKNIETNFKNLISNYGDRIQHMSTDLNNLKITVHEMKVPMTE